MFGNKTYAVFGTARKGKAPGVYFSKRGGGGGGGGYITATGAIEINRDAIEFRRKKMGFVFTKLSIK